MGVGVVLAGVLQQMKSALRGGEHTPYHIAEAPFDEIVLLTAGSVTGPWVDWPGGQGLWTAYQTFDGVTAQLQMSPDGGTTPIDVDVDGELVLLSEGGGFIVTLPAYKVRTKINGVGGGTSISSKMKQC